MAVWRDQLNERTGICAPFLQMDARQLWTSLRKKILSDAGQKEERTRGNKCPRGSGGCLPLIIQKFLQGLVHAKSRRLLPKRMGYGTEEAISDRIYSPSAP